MKTLSLLFLFTAALPLPAAPVISEFLADNDGGLKDEDGEDQDWIEIHNPDPGPVNMSGWHLTDDPLNNSKWDFPNVTIPGDGRLIVWASNKNRDAGQLHTNFKLDNNPGYLALISPAGTPGSQFNPYPFQSKNYSYGPGIGGSVTVTDCTPVTFTGGTNYSRVKLSGAGTAVQDSNSLNVFDDAISLPQHQQYLWYDYSSRLSAIPAGQQIADAVLEWAGEAKLFAGVSNLGTVTTPVGIFAQPDNNRGITAIATAADGNDLVRFFNANTPIAKITIQQGEQRNFTWNVTQLVKDWRANPAAANYGKFIIVPGAHPTWIAWDQNRIGPKLTVRSVTGTPVSVLGFMSAPSPGAPNGSTIIAGPVVRDVTENPPQPAAATGLVITARVTPLQGGAVTTVNLIHRKNWDAEGTVAMADNGAAPDAAAGDGVFTATIPAASVVAGQMLRWRITATDASGYAFTMPPFRDSALAVNLQDSPQYFGTVPADPSIVTPFQVIHRFIQTPGSVTSSTTYVACSVFMNGEFYDNCRINLHGQSTTAGTFPKKSYDVDGNRDFRFKWSPDPGMLRSKDFNLLTIYADKTKIRQRLAYEMNREAGVAAHVAFTTHNRLNGAFDGIYDFVEDGDDVYLERAGLNKDGALYKCYTNMGDPAVGANVAAGNANGVEKKNRKQEDNRDLYNFLQGMHLADANARRAFLFDNLDVPKMINFMAANTTTGNVDLHAKNYYIYRDSGKTDLWTLLPWDLDLSQGRLWTSANNYFDDGVYLNAGGTLSGQGQILVARLYAYPEFSNMAKRRIRSLQDKFWKTSATAPDSTRWYDNRVSQLAAEFGASLTTGQNDVPGKDAALDYSKYAAAAWKNHTGVTGNTAASIYASYTMSQELQRHMSTFVVQRINTMNADGNVPAAYNMNSLTPLTFSAVEHTPASGDQDQEYVAITNPNGISIDLSNWQITGGVSFTFEPGTIVNGTATTGVNANKIYIASSRNAFKTRTVSPKGGESLNVVGGFQGHLSNLGETLNLLDDTGAQRATTSWTGSATPHQLHLVVSEVMYNPGGTGLAEFIELTNISTSVTLNMANVRLNDGVEFNFTGSPVTTLAPGQKCLIVRDQAAFTAAYGNGHTIAGVFANNTALSNGGEFIKVEDPLGNTVKDFAYSDVDPWPAADGTGASLVLKRPETNPDPSLPSNWRASIATGGNPGADDSRRFSGNVNDDIDKDGLTALMEYVLGTSDTVANTLDLHPVRGTDAGGPYIEFTITRQRNADDATFTPQHSTNLSTWNTTGLSIQSVTPGANGAFTETWRLTGPPAAGDRVYLQCRCNHL